MTSQRIATGLVAALAVLGAGVLIGGRADGGSPDDADVERLGARVAHLEERNRQLEAQLAESEAAVPLPDLVGLSADDAEDVVVARGWNLAAEEVASSEDPGTVLSQEPTPGTVLELGAVVSVKIAEPEGG